MSANWEIAINSWPHFAAAQLLSIAFFLSDPSPIIGNACLSLTHSRLVNLIDMTLACEDAYSKHVKVVTVAIVDDEDRVGNSLLRIWKLRFGHINISKVSWDPP